MRTFAVRNAPAEDPAPRVEFFLEEGRENGEEVVHVRVRTAAGEEYYVATIGPEGLERVGSIPEDDVPFLLNEEGEIELV